MLAAEGVFALTLPLVIGPWSDTFHTPLGRRRPFMLVAVGPIGFCLALMAFMPNLWTTALLVFAFFFAYYVYEPPYRGLYPDLLPEQRLRPRTGRPARLPRDRARRRPHPRRHSLPPLAAGTVPRRRGDRLRRLPRARPLPPGGRRSRPRLRGSRRPTSATPGAFCARNPDVGRFLLANAAWEGTFAGARTFVVLYITVGLGEPLSTSTLVLAAVAAGYVIAALVSGPIGDRFGLARVITWCSLVYGLALLGGGLATQWHAWYLAIIFVVALFAGSVMTLAWGLLFKLMPPDERGAISGLATTTKGIGLIFGTLLAGVLIDVLRPYLPATDGYQVLWPILAVPILLAVPLVFSLIGAEEAANGSATFTAGS